MTTQTAQVFEVLCRNVAEIVPGVDPLGISRSGRLADYGCNSLDRSDVVWKTMIDLGIDVPVDRFAAVEDIDGLASLFEEFVRQSACAP